MYVDMFHFSFRYTARGCALWIRKTFSRRFGTTTGYCVEGMSRTFLNRTLIHPDDLLQLVFASEIMYVGFIATLSLRGQTFNFTNQMTAVLVRVPSRLETRHNDTKFDET